jgi:Ca2+-binding EF-hand superfamily protein
MTKILSQSTFVTALLAGLVTLAGCGASTADPSDTTPQAETSAAPVGQNEQSLEHGPDGARGDRGRHHGGMHRKHDAEKMFARMDKDGDGKVLLTDLPERLREHLAKADADKDGALTRDELKAAHQARKAEWMKKVDTNGDGTVSDEEKAAARATFEAEMKKKLDTNGDGTVSDEEKAAARAKFGHGPWHHGPDHGATEPADAPAAEH